MRGGMSHASRLSSISEVLTTSPEGLDADPLDLGTVGGGESSRRPYTGTKALMLAVLDNAITCYLSPVPRLRDEAEYWITTRQARSPFSFTVVCENLGLEPSAVRSALLRLRKRSTAPRPIVRRRRPNVRHQGRLLASRTG